MRGVFLLHTVRIGRWPRVAAGALMMLLLGTMYAWSMFRQPFSALYPQWSISDLSLNFTLSMIFFCLGGIVGGKIISRASNPAGVVVGAALLLAAFLGLSFLPEDPTAAKWLLYLLYGGVYGLGTGICYNSVVSGVSAWFPERTGQITGLLLTAYGLGSMLIGQLVQSLIPTVGLYNVFRILAAVVTPVLLLGSPLTRMPGPDVRLPAAAAKSGGKKDYTTGQMVRRFEFWAFFLWNVCMSGASLMVVNSAANIAAYYGAAAVLGLLVSVVNGLSRIPFGVCIDKLGWKKTLWIGNIALLLTAALLVGGGLTASPLLVLPGMLLMGVCFGDSVTVSAMVIRRFYGSRHYAENLPVINACAIFGAVLGPTLSSRLQEAAGGDYTTTFVGVGMIGIATCILGFLVKEPE